MGNKVQILVVDDEKAVRAMFEKYLTMKNFDVVLAANALEALRIQRRQSPDLVLTDYDMPEMNGVDLMKELHLLAPGLPVIMMSGAADMRTATDALRDEAFDFLTKPVDSDDLIKTIRLALERKAAAENPDPVEIGRIIGPVYASRLPDFPTIAVLAFNRPLDEHGQRAYESAINQLENEGDPLRKIVVVMRNVMYINNVGLNFLLDTFKRWQSQHRQVVFAQLSDPVFRYLRTLGYLDFFPVMPTVTEAVESLA